MRKRGQIALLYTILILLILVFFLLVISAVLQVLFPSEVSPETLVFEGVVSTDSNLAVLDVRYSQEGILVTLQNTGTSTIYGVTVAFIKDGKMLSKQFALPEYLYENMSSTIRISNTVDENGLVYDELQITPHYAKVIATTLDLVSGSFFDTSIAISQESSDRSSGGGGGSSNANNNNNNGDNTIPVVSLPDGTLLFVATNGDDSNDGSQESPLQTLDAAKQKVRTIKAQGLTDDVFVIVREGTYYRETPFELTVDDSGTKDYEITYMAYPGEEVIISGAKIIQPTWTAYDSQIYVADLSGQDMFYSLYVNGERAIRARTANGGYDEMERFPDPAWKKRYTTYFNYNLTKDNVPQIVPEILPTEDVEAVTIVGFKQPRFLIDRIEGYRVYIKGENPPGFNDREDYGRFYLENSFSFLDHPGEWFFDKHTNKLYYYPREGEIIQDSEFIIPQVQQLVHIHGDSPDLHLENGFTIASWIKFDDDALVNSDTPVIMDSALDKRDGFRMELRTPGIPHFRISNETTADNRFLLHYTCDGSDDLSDNTWHHVAGVFDLMNKKFYCYVDGVLVNERNLPHDFSGMVSTPPAIGGSYEFFTGTIDEALVVNRSLNAGEVFSLFISNNHADFEENVVFDMNFEDGFVDSSGETAGFMSSNIYNFGSEIRYNNASLVSGKFGQGAYYDGSWDGTRPTLVGKRVHDITFSDFVFEYADWEMFPYGRYIWDASYHLNDTGAFVMNKSYNITIKDSEVRKVGNAAILGYDSEYLTIHNNHVHNVDASGILVEGKGVIAEDIYSHHTISDNTVHEVGLRDNMATGIFVRYAGHTDIIHNLIYNISYIGIRVYHDLHSFYNLNGYNNISYNEVHDVNVYLNDGGAIYLNGLQPGTVVHHNVVHDLYPTIHHYAGHTNGFYGLYLDEGASGIAVYDNLVYRTYHAGMFLHIPNNNDIYNNIFIDATSPVFSHYIRRQIVYGDGSSYVWAINNSFKRNIVYASDPTVPMAVIGFTSNCTFGNVSNINRRFMDNDYNLYSHNYFLFDQDNPGFCGGVPYNQDPLTLDLAGFQRKFGFEEHSQIGDPLFVDYANDDFRLQPGSPAFSLGFENFDVSGVGPRY